MFRSNVVCLTDISILVRIYLLETSQKFVDNSFCQEDKQAFKIMLLLCLL